MPIGDYDRSLFSRIANGPYDKDKKDKPTTPNLANGGHTGYHPLPPKKARQKDYSADQQNMNQYTVQGADQPMYDTAQQNVWQDASAPMQGQPWGQGWQQTDPTQSQAPWGQGWQQQSWQVDPSQQGTMYTQQSYAQNNGWQNDFSQVNGTGYAPQMNGTGYAPQMNATGYAPAQNGFAQAAAPAQPAGFAQQQNAAPAQNAQSNMGQMHYMPGQFVHEDGKSYSHVERLAQPLSASSCFRLIEFMRNGESIIVNTELIQDERENAHCLDLLYGAAFTMGYTFTKISRLRIYLISPANICVLPYGTIKQLNDEELARRWPGSVPQPKNQTPAGFDFDRLDRKAAGEMENYVPQRRYS